MKINDVIAQVRALTRGKYDDAQLIRWLSRLDAKIYDEIVQGCVDSPDGAFVPYTDGEQDLIAQYVDGEMYEYYLKAKIYASNAETANYNAALADFNTAYANFANRYNRSHMAKGAEITF